jgi:hypothetical protein
MIVEIANLVLHYENHSECTQFAVTCLGKQSMILGYNWLCNNNPKVDWQTKEVKMSCCPVQCPTCHIKNKHDAIAHKAKVSQINTCQSGAFPAMINKLDDQDKSPHVDMSETGEEVQGKVWPLTTTLILMLTTSKLRRVTESLWR